MGHMKHVPEICTLTENKQHCIVTVHPITLRTDDDTDTLYQFNLKTNLVPSPYDPIPILIRAIDQPCPEEVVMMFCVAAAQQSSQLQQHKSLCGGAHVNMISVSIRGMATYSCVKLITPDMRNGSPSYCSIICAELMYVSQRKPLTRTISTQPTYDSVEITMRCGNGVCTRFRVCM